MAISLCFIYYILFWGRRKGEIHWGERDRDFRGFRGNFRGFHGVFQGISGVFQGFQWGFRGVSDIMFHVQVFFFYFPSCFFLFSFFFVFLSGGGSMEGQVKEIRDVFGDLPEEHIRADLAFTCNVTMTMNRIMDGQVSLDFSLSSDEPVGSSLSSLPPPPAAAAAAAAFQFLAGTEFDPALPSSWNSGKKPPAESSAETPKGKSPRKKAPRKTSTAAAGDHSSVPAAAATTTTITDDDDDDDDLPPSMFSVEPAVFQFWAVFFSIQVTNSTLTLLLVQEEDPAKS